MNHFQFINLNGLKRGDYIAIILQMRDHEIARENEFKIARATIVSSTYVVEKLPC